MNELIKQNAALALPLTPQDAGQPKKWAIPVPLLLVIFSALICYLFLLFTLTVMSGTSNLSRQMAKLANSSQVTATLNLTGNCSILTLEALRNECGEVQVTEDYVSQGQLPQLIATLNNPCEAMQGLTETERDEARRYFQCDGKPIPYKMTVSIVKISSSNPEPGTNINKKEKVREIIVNKF